MYPGIFEIINKSFAKVKKSLFQIKRLLNTILNIEVEATAKIAQRELSIKSFNLD